MKISDLLKVSITNLIRRKLRTSLTVLGVVIGTVSVVIMLSIGFGISAISQKMYEGEQALTRIMVTSRESMDDYYKKDKIYLTDKAIESIRMLEHVKHVSPYLQVAVSLKQGKWEVNYAQIEASDEQFFKGIQLKEGEFPKATDDKMSLVYGNNFITDFYNSKTNKGYWETQVLADVDYNRTIFTTYNVFSVSTGNEEQGPPKPPKKYIYPTAGVVKGALEDYNPFSYGVYTHIELLKKELKKIYRGKAIPGQPTTKSGKPLSFFVYPQVFVYAEHLKYVEELQKTIGDLGYEAQSELSWLMQVKKQTQMLQGMLGGIGLVSLVVAAIGIANTMMMSIYERTKEIGIMKVLGCDMNRIRDMFLLESAMIGFGGGIFGVLISYGVSHVANHLPALQAFFNAEGSAISIIPPWLTVVSIVFATFIGTIAGLLPSLRAMRLSPLAALRNE